MCGISGFNSFDLQNRSSIIAEFQKNLKHRGPDHTDYYNYNNLSVISNRLSILDLTESGNQPMTDISDRYTIVYNGEIYNYKDLNIQYLKDYKFNSNSDTETILALICKMGVSETCKLLDGMFAFALLDKQTNQLYLVRDRYGQKPIYYGIIGNNFIFSSEIKLFNYFPNFENKISNHGKYLYFKYGYIKYPNTIYKNIYKVEPGSILTINLSDNKYFSDKFFDKNNFFNNRNISNNEASFKDFKNILSNSVKNHLMSDREVGTFLSGGNDSSLITYFAQKILNKKIHTFNIGFDEIDYDESEEANNISRKIGTNHHTFILNQDVFNQIVLNIRDYLDEPFADSSFIPTIFLSQESKKFVDVVLTGDGADEFYAGYNRYKYSYYINKYIFLIKLSFRKSIKKVLSKIKPNFFKYFFKILPFKLTKRDYENFNKFIDILDAKNIIDIYNKIIDDKNFFKFENINEIITIPQSNPLDQMLFLDQSFYLSENGMTKIDRASMYFSLESRCPFLSNEVTNFSWKLTNSILTNNFKTLKSLPKKLFKNLIGEKFIQKNKTGFSIPPSLFYDSKVKEKIIFHCNNFLDSNIQNIDISKFNKAILSYKNNQYFDNNLWKIYVYQVWISKL